MPTINDYFSEASNGTAPIVTSLASQKAFGASSLSLTLATGWDTTTPSHFLLYEVNASNKLIPGTITIWKGLLAGTTMSSLSLRSGTDLTYPAGSIVELAPTSAWADDLVDGILTQHKQDGTHTGITTDTLAASSTLAVTGASTLTGAIGGTGYSLATMSNPYKFSVYRAAAFTANSPVLIPFDTKLFDTGSNVDVVTHKGRFTAPINGFYYFSATTAVTVGNGAGLFIAIYKNGSFFRNGSSLISAVGSWDWGLSVSGLMQLSTNDYIEIYVYGSGNPATVGQGKTYFDGFLMSAT